MYGTANQGLICAEFATGNTLWQDRAIGPASVCYADDRLYLHGENGEVALVEATTEGYREKGRFSPPGRPSRINPMEKSWAYPVVADGKLFIRDHGVLWCYDVRGK
jgi:outer membrane protein assembly factor BamB